MNSFNCFICKSLPSWKCNCLNPCTFGCWDHIEDHLKSNCTNHEIIIIPNTLEPVIIEKIKNLHQINIEEITLKAKYFDEKIDKILRKINEKREEVMYIAEDIINEKSQILDKLKTSPLHFWDYEVIQKINNDNVQDWLVEINFFDYEKLENAVNKFEEAYKFGESKKLKQINAELISCKNELKNLRITFEAKEKKFNDIYEDNKAYKDIINKWDLQIKDHENQLKFKDQYYEELIKEKEESWNKLIKEKEENFMVEYKNLKNDYEILIPNANIHIIIEKESKIKELEEVIKEKEKTIEELNRKIRRSSMQIKTEEEIRGDNKAKDLINKVFQKSGEVSKKVYGNDKFVREKKIKTHGESGYEPEPHKKAKYNN
ncbi:unnamed protein product [Blepharisma stoltei]|uniref:Uncharacterized protein n=1 Tax=Blepharisma stoltei TaxID=1481888 RepID=A0AAU9J8S4_9CILI|nr:unnamed protein product [Blepharisma stoltei]